MIFDGELGVRFFFVISGFLITWLMLIEAGKCGRVSLKNFYIRRALRILPVYFAFLGSVGLLQLLTPFHQDRWAWFANITFTTGIPISGGSWTTAHLWSLAVEEQFYLIWPVIFVLGGLATSSKRAFSVLIAPIALAVVFRWGTFPSLGASLSQWLHSPYTFPTNCDALAIGCAAAILLRHHRTLAQNVLLKKPRAIALLGLAAIVVPHMMRTEPSFFSHILRTIQALGFSVIMLQSIFLPGLGAYRLLNLAPIVHLGILSYSLYIWQQLFCTDPAAFGLVNPWWMSFPWWILTALLVSSISYYALEIPFMNLRSRLRA